MFYRNRQAILEQNYSPRASLKSRGQTVVPFALPECSADEMQEAIEVIKSGWLTTASRTFRFEKEFAERIGAKFCLAVNSGTAALHLALKSLGIGPRNNVIVPVHTFTATAEVVRYLDADPLFADVDRETFCIGPSQLQDTLSSISFETRDRVKALIPVHFGGHPCDMDEILNLARHHKLRVVEDAAHAFPTIYVNSPSAAVWEGRAKKMAGTIGDVGCFSFYANKTITTGEGGMLATDDDEIAKRVKVMRLHGIDRDVWDRFSDSNADWAYDVVAPGFKYNMPDLAAALGIHQLRRAEYFRRRRQYIAETYYRELADTAGLILPRIKCSIENHAWHLYVVLIEPKENTARIDRNRFIQKMKQKNIGTSVHYIPLHRMTYYRKRYGLRPEMFPNSEWIFQRCVSLPIYSAMTDEQLEYVIKSIKQILR